MPDIVVFAEDRAHELVIRTLVGRIAANAGISASIKERSVRGGFPTVQRELKQFTKDIRKGVESCPDLLIVATDCNCKGFNRRIEELRPSVNDFAGTVVFAVPDPHVERWLLLDSQAFKKVAGRGCSAPDHKCARDRYKSLLASAFKACGFSPALGGIEYAEDILAIADLDTLKRGDASLGRFITDLGDFFRRSAL